MIKVRPGVVLTHVCGQSLLVTAFEARSRCPYVTILNETGEIIWNCLKDKRSVPEIVLTLRNMFDIPCDTNVEELINDYIGQLFDNGYVVYEEEENNDTEKND